MSGLFLPVNGNCVHLRGPFNVRLKHDPFAVGGEMGVGLDSPQAVETLRDGIEGRLGGSAHDHLKLKAAESILDRAGYGRVSKVDSRVAVGYIKEVGIAEIKRRAREIGIVPEMDTHNSES